MILAKLAGEILAAVAEVVVDVASNAARRPFDVLVVCTGNLCRSPIAEHLLQAAADRLGLDWQVGSAGVAARPGQAMHPFARAVLAERGIEVAQWATRRLDASLVRSAGLVLTAEVAHRRAVLAVAPGAVRRTFTLLEFATLAHLAATAAVAREERPPADGESLVQRALVARAHPQARDQRVLDLDDPIDGPIEAFRATAAQVDHAVRRLVAPFDRDRATVAETP